MRQDTRLFINNEEIEFSQDPKILLNYTQKELTNPTIVRNSFTKSIEIEGTSKNNDIFGHIWSFDRYQAADFNPIKKAPFELYVNGELFQKGYAKLDKVVRTNNSISYSLTLYGGLGEFFANLTYNGDSASGKRNLASLRYSTGNAAEPDLSFDITKDTVKEAWDSIMGEVIGNDKWNVINFAPCYNGIPSDFDADKALINYSGNTQGFITAVTEDNKIYQPFLNGAPNSKGYALGELIEDLTEWESRDLRSYHQRPVLSIYRLFEAIKDPANNGGYQVDLDDHFFNNLNPYYRDAWMTLPMLRDLDGVAGGESETIYSANITGSGELLNVNFGSPTLSSLNNVNMRLQVSVTPTNTSASKLYTHRKYTSRTSFTLSNQYVKEYEYAEGLVLQLLAYDGSGNVVGQSKAYLLGSVKNNPYNNEPLWKDFWKEGDPGVEPEYEFLQGLYTKIGGNYVFTDRNGNPIYIDFHFDGPTDYTSLKLRVRRPYGNYFKYTMGGRSSLSAFHTGYSIFYSQEYTFTQGNYTPTYVQELDRYYGNHNYSIVSFEAVATDYASLFSGSRINKDKLLATEYTPADYLLSYCKLFGLYFYHDETEEATDTEKYPNGVIHIMDRDTFYTEEVVNLDELIDWNKKLTITPSLAETKWYRFDVEHIDGEADKDYEDEYGHKYGVQLVNTNYDFSNDIKDLYDGNAFKAGVMVLEKDKYFKMTDSGNPSYVYNGLSYSLFNTSNGTINQVEVDYPRKVVNTLPNINKNGYGYYDGFAKLQLHGEDNASADGSGVLLFFNGSYNLNTPSGMPGYYLTDDVQDMVALNDATPCWILTNCEYDGGGRRIAYKLSSLPLFTRDLMLFGETGNIVHSWNFGHPQVTYRPDVYTTEGDSIYDVAWKNYIRDLFNENTRKLTCYVKVQMDGRPWPYWLRRYYWFENSLWALNSIKDLNMASFDTTQMEFIKVEDIENYKLDRIQYRGAGNIILDTHNVGCTGGTITGKIYNQSAGGWAAADYFVGRDTTGGTHYITSQTNMIPYTGYGQTISTFRLVVPANNGNYPITWTIRIQDDQDVWYTDTFIQSTCAQSYLRLNPTALTVQSSTTQAIFNIESQGLDTFNVALSENWATATINNNQVVVTFAANTGSSRSLTISLTGNNEDETYTAAASLTQNAAPVAGVIYFDGQALTVGYQSGITDQGFTYSNIESTALRITSSESWARPRISFVPQNEVFVDYTENTTLSPRTANITLYAYDARGIRVSDTFVLTQNPQPGSTISTSTDNITFPYMSTYPQNLGISGTSGTYNITITDN